MVDIKVIHRLENAIQLVKKINGNLAYIKKYTKCSLKAHSINYCTEELQIAIGQLESVQGEIKSGQI